MNSSDYNKLKDILQEYLYNIHPFNSFYPPLWTKDRAMSAAEDIVDIVGGHYEEKE